MAVQGKIRQLEQMGLLDGWGKASHEKTIRCTFTIYKMLNGKRGEKKKPTFDLCYHHSQELQSSGNRLGLPPLKSVNKI